MKKYLKNKEGMALPMVLIIMTVLSLFATGLALYAHNSYLSVRWMNEEKRAYYLARAGVEAAAYAYQNAVSKTSSNYSDLNKYESFNAFDKFVTISEDGAVKITTNKVYLRYSNSGGNAGTRWGGLEFKTYASENEAVADTSCIGYFEVQIGDGTDEIRVSDSNGTVTPQNVDVKVFRSKAVCGEKSQVAFGYITPAENVAPLELYDNNGVLYYGENAKDEFTVTTRTINFKTNIESPGDNFLKRFFKGIIKSIFEYFKETSRDISLYAKSGEGNMILSKPADSKYIRGNDGMDNFYVFATTGDLFLDNVGIEATPTKGHYESIGLYGDEIVVDGDITMEVYYSSGNKFTSTLAMIGNRFRLGTVVIGDAARIPTQRRDPVPLNKGGLQYNGASVPANKIYFNGNVYVKIYTQGGSTETYRVFNAGDMAYFYGAYTEAGTVITQEDGTVATESKGIDLLKYFIDAALANKDGYNYGEALKNKLRSVRELYYGKESKSYFDNGNVLVRKIVVDYNANGLVEVDGDYGTVMDIIQPSPTDSTSLIWGRPRGGDVFQ